MASFLISLTVAFAQVESPADEAIDQQARRFRILTYQHYRHDRTAYDRRIARSKRAESYWNSGRLSTMQYLDWLTAANRSVSSPLPNLPSKSTTSSRATVEVKRKPSIRSQTLRSRSPGMPSELRPRAVLPGRIELPIPSRPRFKSSFASKHRKAGLDRWRPSLDLTTMPDDSIIAPVASSVVGLPPDPRQQAANDRPSAAQSIRSLKVDSVRQTTQSESSDDRINLAVLSALIESENLRFNSIEAKLFASLTIDIDELELIVTDMDQLIERRKVSQLYRNLLTAIERRQVTHPVDINPVITALNQRIFEIESFVLSNRTQAMELDRFRRITERVQSWQN